MGISAQLDHFPIASATLLQERSLLTRREDKFVLPIDLLSQFLPAMVGDYQVVRCGSLGLVDYETLYLDSDDQYLYQMRETGVRQKVRLRRYTQRQVCYLEVKSKTTDGIRSKERTKHEYACNELSLGDRDFVRTHIRGIDMLPSSVSLTPQVVVRYQRITFLRTRRTERMTLDLGLHYLHEGGVTHLDDVVVEVKRPPVHEPSVAVDWLYDHGVAASAFSKYKTGLSLRGNTAQGV